MTRPWTVFRPRPLRALADGLWAVEDDIPGIPGASRRMVVVRRASGELLFYNAVPFGEATRKELLALGKPAQLVLPNRYHALDAAAFVSQLGVTAYAPAAALEPLKERVTARSMTEFPVEDGVQVVTIDGFKTKEAVLVVGRKEKSLVVGDLFTCEPHRWTPYGVMMRLIGFSGPAPKLPTPVKRRVLADAKAVRATLEHLAGLEGLTRLVPSHGLVTEGGAAEALRAIAAKL